MGEKMGGGKDITGSHGTMFTLFLYSSKLCLPIYLPPPASHRTQNSGAT